MIVRLSDLDTFTVCPRKLGAWCHQPCVKPRRRQRRDPPRHGLAEAGRYTKPDVQPIDRYTKNVKRICVQCNNATMRSGCLRDRLWRFCRLRTPATRRRAEQGSLCCPSGVMSVLDDTICWAYICLQAGLNLHLAYANSSFHNMRAIM